MTGKPASKDSALRDKVLKRLQSGAAHCVPTADAPWLSLEWPGPRRLRVPALLLQCMQADGLITRRGDTVTITQAGHSALARFHTQDADLAFAAQNGATRDARRVSPSHDELPRPVFVNAHESPLSRLAQLKSPDGSRWINDLEFAAGDRLRRDFERAGMSQRVTMSYDPARIAGGRSRNQVADMSDTALAARDRLQEALDHIGPELAGVALDVCCFLKGLEQVESERQWPRRSAKLLLKAALGALARHYFPVARGRSRSGRLESWGTAGYRPSF